MDQPNADFKELTKQILQMHECIDGMREEQQDLKALMSNNFLGISPETHVRHHNTITDQKEAGRGWRRGLVDIVVIVAATVLLNMLAVNHLLAETRVEPATKDGIAAKGSAK